MLYAVLQQGGGHGKAVGRADQPGCSRRRSGEDVRAADGALQVRSNSQCQVSSDLVNRKARPNSLVWKKSKQAAKATSGCMGAAAALGAVTHRAKAPAMLTVGVQVAACLQPSRPRSRPHKRAKFRSVCVRVGRAPGRAHKLSLAARPPAFRRFNACLDGAARGAHPAWVCWLRRMQLQESQQLVLQPCQQRQLSLTSSAGAQSKQQAGERRGKPLFQRLFHLVDTDGTPHLAATGSDTGSNDGHYVSSAAAAAD